MHTENMAIFQRQAVLARARATYKAERRGSDLHWGVPEIRNLISPWARLFSKGEQGNAEKTEERNQ